MPKIANPVLRLAVYDMEQRARVLPAYTEKPQFAHLGVRAPSSLPTYTENPHSLISTYEAGKTPKAEKSISRPLHHSPPSSKRSPM